MSITPITVDQLRRIEDHDGLILQGCGGSLQGHNVILFGVAGISPMLIARA